MSPVPDVRIDGDGPDTIVMVHGWPDTWRLWDAQVRALSPHHRCARFTLPGFDPGDERRLRGLDEIVDALHRVVVRAGGGRPVTLLLHDWGCVFGYRFAAVHPGLVERVVGLDVGDGGSPEHLASLGTPAKLGIAAYQNWLALAWRVGGPVGDAMTRAFARAVRAPGNPATISSAMNYPYRVQWSRGEPSYAAVRSFDPVVPTLFVHGTDKPFALHSAAWARRVDAAPGSRTVAMDAGHWMMRDRPDELNALLLEWLDATAGAARNAAPSTSESGSGPS